MLVFCKVTYGPQVGDGSFNPSASYSGSAFNTDTLQMEQVSGTWRGTILDDKPADVYLATGTLLHVTCVGTTGTVYRYQRTGDTFTTSQEVNSVSCGWTPPETRTCTLLVNSVTVNYDRATVNCANYIGPLEYSLNGGLTRQQSNVFTELSPGTYTATVHDLGATLPGCSNTRQFTIATTAPAGDVASCSPLPQFCLAGNPILVQVQAAVAYHYVLVQVWVETAHRSGSYTLAYESKRRSNSNRLVQLDVHDVLEAELSQTLNLNNIWRQLSEPARNWFVRAADVLPQNGQPGTWATSNNSLVLAGGLSPEALTNDGVSSYWQSARLRRTFTSWQPADKVIGPEHREVLQLLVPDALSAAVLVEPSENGTPLPERQYLVPAPIAQPTAHNAVIPPPLSADQQVRFMQFMLVAEQFGGATQFIISVIDTSGAVPEEPPAPLVLDVATNASPRQLIFQNSLAGYDTLALFGKLTGKLSMSPTVIDAYQNGNALIREARSWSSTDTVSNYALSTGWLSTAWLEYLRELVEPGRQVYEWFDGQLRPVVVTTKELLTHQEVESLMSTTIEYRPALTNSFFTDYARNTDRQSRANAGW